MNTKEIVQSCPKSQTMCYICSDIIFKKYKTGTINEKTFNSGEEFYNFMIKKQDPVYNIEILITTSKTFTESKKNDLMEKYNIKNFEVGKFVFKNPNLRLFVHAFNIITTDDETIVGQSWFNTHPYKIMYIFPDANKYVGYLKYLANAIDIFQSNPYKLYKAFGFFKIKNKNEANIIKMINDLNFDVDIEIKCMY